MSKQTAYQRRNVARGLCPSCGRPRGETQRCEDCREKKRVCDASRWRRKREGATRA